MGLTDLQVRKIKAKSGRYEISDGNGLAIRVLPSGTKTWVFRYQYNARPRRMSMGRYPAVSLAMAREKHGKAWAELQKGIDPGRIAIDIKAKQKKEPTFNEMLNEIWDIELSKKKSGVQTKKLIEKNVLPYWGNRKVSEVKRRDIVLLLDKINKRAPIVRNRVQGALSRFFNFAAERGVIPDSPCTRIKKVPEKGRSRVLTDDEIKLLWIALDLENKAIDIYRVTKLAIKLILLTGQRPGEVCGMEWGEIEDDIFWNIPAAKMKNNEPHRVPLTEMALAVIKEAKIYSGDCEYVFSSSYKTNQAMTRHGLSRAVARHFLKMGIAKFTPHDLRRTFRTKLAEIGVSDIFAERVMGHKLQGIMAVYNRHSYDAEKREALERWEQKLCEILGTLKPDGKIIKIKEWVRGHV